MKLNHPFHDALEAKHKTYKNKIGSISNRFPIKKRKVTKFRNETYRSSNPSPKNRAKEKQKR